MDFKTKMLHINFKSSAYAQTSLKIIAKKIQKYIGDG
jgi:hypothetical protein